VGGGGERGSLRKSFRASVSFSESRISGSLTSPEGRHSSSAQALRVYAPVRINFDMAMST